MNIHRTLYTKLFFRDRFLLAFLVVSLGINAFVWANIFLKMDILAQPQREFILLHYKVFLGPDYYAAWQTIFFLPAIGLGIIILNYYLGFRAYHYQRLISYSVHCGSALCQAIILLAVLLIIQINIF